MSLMMSPLKLPFHCNFVNTLQLNKISGIRAFFFAPPPHHIDIAGQSNVNEGTIHHVSVVPPQALGCIHM
jgi:hypothetical protein